MTTHTERIDNLEEEVEQLKEKKEDPEQFVSSLLKDVFSNLGEEKAGDLSGFISKQIDDYIRQNFVSKDELEYFISRNDLRDVLKELCNLLQTEIGVNTALLEKEIKIFLPKEK